MPLPPLPPGPTTLKITSSYFLLPSGTVLLPSCSLLTLTILQIKLYIHHFCLNAGESIGDIEGYRVWWNGYLLDGDDLCVSEACVGLDAVNERIDSDVEELTLFLTIGNNNDNDNNDEEIEDNDSDNRMADTMGNNNNVKNQRTGRIKKDRKSSFDVSKLDTYTSPFWQKRGGAEKSTCTLS